MEKLIDLLNEYNEGGHWRDENFDRNKLLVISKGYGFIKWLVENDKIAREEFYDKARKIITDFDLIGEYEGACNEILMILAIQDNTIEFLISILK